MTTINKQLSQTKVLLSRVYEEKTNSNTFFFFFFVNVYDEKQH